MNPKNSLHKEKTTSTKENQLYLAIIQGKLDELKNLSENNLNSMRFTNYGWSALHLAVWYGRIDVIDYMIQKGYEKNMINCQDLNGETPLHLAVYLSQPDLICKLVKKGAILTVKNKVDQAPFDLITQNDQYEKLKALENSELSLQFANAIANSKVILMNNGTACVPEELNNIRDNELKDSYEYSMINTGDERDSLVKNTDSPELNEKLKNRKKTKIAGIWLKDKDLKTDISPYDLSANDEEHINLDLAKLHLSTTTTDSNIMSCNSRKR